MAAEGLITLPSSLGPKDTMDRLAAEVKSKGLTVFARIDRAAEAAEVGLTLKPTYLGPGGLLFLCRVTGCDRSQQAH
jgi:uncharacterized protein (DUF302 family)